MFVVLHKSVSGTGDLVVGAPLADSPRSTIAGAVYLEGGILPAFLESVACGMAGKHIGSGESSFQLLRMRISLTTTLGKVPKEMLIKVN